MHVTSLLSLCMARALVASKYRGQLDFGEDPARTRFVGVPSPGKASTGKVGCSALGSMRLNALAFPSTCKQSNIGALVESVRGQGTLASLDDFAGVI
ncbi:hypothetical protein S40285_10034 [Stachybotrys chlorohalonatus IBT 40285]|uniref:Uncharacterized protein n=1 Tax=Stachybotrys chlorohalonatus (strain IBT 40285) TaxID=1283841 RepID=A0A084QAN7_STAC4|nr:hypothetical protein S40285_10034 [Stachybotrys chlorohalonata IBT 40285]